MKRFLTLAFVMLFAFGANAQQLKGFAVENSKKEKSTFHKVPNSPTNALNRTKGVILNETFDAWPPTAWGFFEFGDAAGWKDGTGSAYHADDNVDTGCDDWMVTPALVIASTDFTISFDQYQTYSTYYEEHNVVVLNGADPSTATILETLLTGAGTDGAWTPHSFSLNAYNGQTIYIGFQYKGDYADTWSIDNVQVAEPEAHDLGVSAITPDYMLAANASTPTVSIVNIGLNEEATYTVQLVIANDGGTVYDETVNGVTVAVGAEVTVDMAEWANPILGAYTATATVSVTNDGNATNDSYAIDLDVFQAGQLMEDFEGDTFLPTNWSETATALSFQQSNADAFPSIIGRSAYLKHKAGSAEEMLITPKLTLDGTVTELNFLAKDGNGAGTSGYSSIQMKYSTDAASWTDLGSVLELNHADPVLYTIDLSAIANGDYYFAFAATSTYDNGTFESFTTIDNVLGPVKTDAVNNDLEVLSIKAITDFVKIGDVVTVSATIKNTGINQQTGNTITLNVAGASVATTTIGTLSYYGTEEVTFNWTVTEALGKHTLEVTVPADDNTDNNSYSTAVVVNSVTGLMEDFEGDFLPTDWSETAATLTWAQSNVDAFPAIIGRSAYLKHDLNSAEEMLITPQLTLDGTVTELNFLAKDANGGIGYGFATLQIKYSADAGVWTDLGVAMPLSRVVGLYTIDLSALANGDYLFGFATTSTFDLTNYTSYTTIDNVQGPKAKEIISSINEINSDVNIYPNPSTGEFNINVNGTYTLQVIDLTGKIISTQEITNATKINLDNSGIYMLRLTNNIEVLNYKVIVE